MKLDLVFAIAPCDDGAGAERHCRDRDFSRRKGEMQRRFELELLRERRARLPAALLAALALGFVVPQEAIAAENAMRIVIGNGPFAGNYSLTDRLRMDSLSCFSAGGNTEIAYKFGRKKADVEQFVVPNPKTISEAQVVVENPTDAKPKSGYFSVRFGNRHKQTVELVAYAPEGTMSLSTAGDGHSFIFKGRTKDGIAIEATASCSHTLKV